MTAKAPAAMGPTSPWMTVTQVATYTNRHPDTVYDALHEHEYTHGRRGLRGSQKSAHARWRIHVDDVDAWVRGEKPPSTRGRLGRAS